MCLPISKILRRLRSSKARKATAEDFYQEKSFESSTTVDLGSTAYSSTNSSFVKPSQYPLPVRTIKLKEHKAAAATLAQAFENDEVAFYFLDTPDKKDLKRSDEATWKLHTKIMEYTVAAHCRKGLVLSIGENNEGVALWMPPGQNMDDWWTMFRSGMWKLYFKLSKEGRKRWFKEFLPKLHDTKHDVMGERDPNSWYLVYIGVTPEAQGRGFSRRLVEHVTEMADEQNVPCYVESSARKNVAIYERFGFEKLTELVLDRAEHEVMLDIMVREPGVHCVTHSEKPSLLD